MPDDTAPNDLCEYHARELLAELAPEYGDAHLPYREVLRRLVTAIGEVLAHPSP